ncbi:MAG: hypothetical protein ACOYBW_08755 [Fluviibacter phosphoraccumulans]
MIDTRPRTDGTTRRRYQCHNEHRFSTVEAVAKPNKLLLNKLEIKNERLPLSHPATTQ